MKKLLCVIGLICVIMTLSSCGGKAAPLNLKICGSYAVPGMFCFDLKGTETTYEIKETDSEGRILFEYTAKNEISRNTESVLVICQSYDRNTISFYEDICWTSSYETEADISEFKEQNDWNLPLNQSKMSSRMHSVTFDYFIDINFKADLSKVKFLCCDFLDISQSQIRNLSFVDNSNGKVMYLCTLTDELTCYLVMYDEATGVKCLEVPDGQFDKSEYIKFKQENGWFDEEEKTTGD